MILRFRKNFKINSWGELFLILEHAVVFAGVTSWLYVRNIYDSLPDYEQLVAGFHIWDGYNKQGDVSLFYLLVIFIPAYAFLFTGIRSCIRGKLPVTDAARETDRQDGGKFFLSFLRNILDGIMAVLIGLYGIRAVFTGIQGVFGTAVQRRNLIFYIACVIEVLWVVFIIAVSLFKKDMKEKALAYAQLCLPLQFLGMYRFCYDYAGEDAIVVLYASKRFRLLCIGLCVAFLGIMLYRLYKKKDNDICMLMLLAAGAVMRTPAGRLSVDFFHNGEMALPMQQLLGFGRLPYWDIEPIHGFCDFYYSLINVLFFDGSYFSQNAGSMVGNVLFALLLGAVLALCVKNRYISFAAVILVLPYLVQVAGVRYLFFYIAFLLLLSDDIQRDSRKFLWLWVFFCMVSISWNVAIGASMAVAFLPQALYLFFKEWIPKVKTLSRWKKEEKTVFFVSYGFLAAGLMCYIPLFLQILRYLSENTGTTVLINGQQIFGEEFHLFKTFAIFILLLFFTGFCLCGKGKAEFWAVLTGTLVLINYICVRYDGGNRLEFAAVFFSLLFICMAGKEETRLRIAGGRAVKSVCMLFCGAVILIACRRDIVLPVGTGMKAEKIPSEEEILIGENKITDPIVYLSGDSVGLDDLGAGFIQASTLNSLKNIQAVFRSELSEEEAYLDFTNKISHYVIYGKECIVPYTSVYNISNRDMQEKAIAIIKEEKPRLILIAPCIIFDQLPVSLRSYELYKTVMDMGYQPYYYEDVVYLLSGTSRMEEAKQGERMLGNYLHRRNLQMLPYLWGTALNDQTDRMKPEILLSAEQTEDGIWTVKTEGTGAQKTAFLRLTVPRDALFGKDLIIRFHSDVDGEGYEFTFDNLSDRDMKEDEVTFLVPAGSSPFWYFSDIKSYSLVGTNEISSISLIGTED